MSLLLNVLNNRSMTLNILQQYQCIIQICTILRYKSVRRLVQYSEAIVRGKYPTSSEKFGMIHRIHIHTYVIGHYNPSVRIIDLVSLDVCVNFIHKWRDVQFKIDSERQIFWEPFHGNYIFSQSFCQKSAERKSPKKYFSYFVLMSGFEPWLFV